MQQMSEWIFQNVSLTRRKLKQDRQNKTNEHGLSNCTIEISNYLPSIKQ